MSGNRLSSFRLSSISIVVFFAGLIVASQMPGGSGLMASVGAYGGNALSSFKGLGGFFREAATPAIAIVTAAAVIDAPATAPLGQPFNFNITFDNTSGVTGYGPYINLFMPIGGVDGVSGGGADDGYAFNSASYLRQTLDATVLSCPSGGSVMSPVTALSVVCPTTANGRPTQLAILQMPFGSFTPAQPPAPIIVSATMSNQADVGTNLPILASAGFIYGSSPTGREPSEGARITANTAASLFKIAKVYNGPENETATGPNYPRSYTITPSMPPGMTAANVMVIDALPENIVYLGVSGAGITVNNEPPLNQIVTAPNNQLKLTLGSVTTGSPITVSFYIPQNNSAGAAIVNPTTGAAGSTANTATAMGEWTPLDSRDGGLQPVSDASAATTIADRSIAIQKSISNNAPPASPGDVLTYTLDFQISDYFSFTNIIVMDTLSDGQDFNAGSASLNVVDRNGTVTGAIAVTAQDNTPTAGQTKLSFDVSQALIALGAADGVLQGGRAVAPDAAAARGRITFSVTVRDVYKATSQPVLATDFIGDTGMISGDVLPNGNLAGPPTGTATDATDASVEFGESTLAKSIYAINGSTAFTSPARIRAGDQVTFRIRQSFPSGDYRNFVIIDTLPLPLFRAETLTNLTFNNTNSGVPATGAAQFGPSNSGAPLVSLPSITVSPGSADNEITFTFPDNNDPTNTPTTVDLLFTLTAIDAPYIDNLLFTNQADSRFRNTSGITVMQSRIVGLTVAGIRLNARKGVVAAGNPAGVLSPSPTTPPGVTVNPANACAARLSGAVTSATLGAFFDSNLTNVDAADSVTYAIVVENTGSGPQGAFDAAINDAIPAGATLTPGSVCVNNGAGASIPFTGSFPGAITLTDPSDSQGALAQGVSYATGSPVVNTTGSNIAVITYTVTLDSTVAPRQVLDNTATLTNAALLNGGVNQALVLPLAELTDTARVTIADPTSAKALVGTEINTTGNAANRAVIGELVSYRLTITAPEGTSSNVSIVDTLDAGLAFVDVSSVTFSPGLIASNAVTTGAAPTNTTITSSGRIITFNLGTLTNANANNAVAETVTIEYRAVVLNTSANQNNQTRNNSAVFRFNGVSIGAAQAPNITIIEPQVTTAKTVSIDGGPSATSQNADAGDMAQYTITLTQAANTPAAFDVTLSDPIPPAITLPVITGFTDSAGLLTSANFLISGGTLQTVASFDLFDQATARTITIRVRGTLANTVMPRDSFPNTATTRWSSLDGAPGQGSTYNTSSTERDGSGGTNDYVSTGTATINIFPTNPVKTLASSSEATTTGAGLAIGEIARYRLRVRIPEGEPKNFILRDNLPAGLQFLNDGTAKFGFVTNGGMGMSSSTLDASALGCNGVGGAPSMILLGDQTNVASLTPSCPLPGSAISDNATTDSDAFSSGTDPFFKFGDVANTDNDLNEEYVVVEFNALTLNIPANASGATLSNDFTVLSGGADVGGSAAVIATVVEPVVSLAKTATPVTGDAGDVIQFSVMYTNAGLNASMAFDVRLVDALPAFLTLNAASVTATGAGGASVPVNNSAGNSLDITAANIPVGGSLTIRYSATLNANVPSGLTLNNTANASWSSLPGPNGSTTNPTGSSTPGSSGSGTGERVAVGGAQAQVAVATPVISKLAPSTASYTVGSIVTYDLRVTLPEGETRNLVVVDDLPAGMSYLGHSIVTSSGGPLTGAFNGSALAPTLAPAAPADGDALSFSFGTVTTTADNNAPTNSFLIRVQTRVNNVSGNINGALLRNDARLSYTNPNTSTTETSPVSSQTITVIEPKLQVVKTPSTNTPRCGDIVTYTIVVSHTAASAAAAQDVVLGDVIPAGMSYVAGSLRLVSGTPAPAVLSEAGGAIDGTFTTFPLGSTVTLEYKAQIPNCPPETINRTFTNTVNLTWTSLAGANPDERTGAGGVNNYTAVDSANVTITQPSIITAKINNPTNGVTLMPGDGVTYTITIQNTGNAPATGVTFTDAIPANTTYVPASTTLNGAAVADVVGPGMPFATGANVNTPGEASGVVNNGETATVTFRVTINNPLPLGVTQVSNQGLIKGSNIPDTPTNIVVNPVTGNPTLSTVKSVNNLTRGAQAPAQSGDLLEYLVVVTNNGNVPATSATLTDAIPANTTYQAASTTLNNAVVPDIAGAMPYVTASEIHSPLAPAGELNVGAGNAAYVRFRVTVNAVLTPPTTTQITNTATAAGQGPNGVLPPATGEVNTPVLGNPVFTPLKSVVNLTHSSGAAQPGDILEYTIGVTNTGNIASTGTTLTDGIPANTICIAGSATLNGAAAADLPGPIAINSPGSPAGELLVGAINQATVKFRVQIVNPLPIGVTQITNQAMVMGVSPSGPVGPTPSNLVTTPVTANPVLGAVKTVRNLTRGGGTAQPGDVLEYTISVTNTGDIASTGTTFTDPIPANTSYVAGSTALNGAAAGDLPGPIALQSPGAPAGQLNVGVSEAAIVVFQATINNPFPSNVLDVVNQASVSGNGPTGAVGPTQSNQVTTPVGANPVLNPVKSVVNLSRSTGTAQPGDQLEYTVVITNTGDTAATSAVFTDPIPANTTYVAGSTRLNGAAAGDMPGPIAVQSPGAPVGRLDVGAANAATVTFRVTIDNPTPPGVTEIRNRGGVSGNGQGGNPLTTVQTNEVITPLAANPLLAATKSVVNLSRTMGTAMPGDELEYSVTVTNSGTTASVNSVLSDAIPANTTYTPGSTQLNGVTLTDVGGLAPYSSSGPIQSPGAAIGQVDAGAAQAAVVRFRVVINTPLPPNVNQVVNQAMANGEGPTGNQVGPVLSPPVITPIGANPALSPVKSVANLTRSAGTAQPGDTLEYTVTIENTGNIAATAAALTDAIPTNTSYISNTTKLNNTAVADVAGAMPFATPYEIHSPGAPAGQLNVGASQAAVVMFRVIIDAALPVGVTRVVNQATANGNGPINNPVGPTPSNPVTTPLLTNPVLDPAKSVVNLTQASGTASPGDTLEYTITVTNTGNTPSVNTILSDPIPGNTTYVAGSTMLNGVASGSITPGPLFISSPGAPAGQLNVGAANRAIITFRVTINDPLPPNVTAVTNMATTNGEGPGNVPVGPVAAPPIVTPVGANAILSPTKTVANLTHPTGSAAPGDVLEYTVRVENTGDIAATTAILNDPIPANTTYVAGSTTLNGAAAPDLPGPIAIGSPGAPAGQLDVGAAQAAVVRFRVAIDNPLPPNVTVLSNVANANANGPTGSPVGPVASNVVLTPVGASPVLALTKTETNLTRSSGTAKPGDVLKYTITVVNNGDIAATGATLADAIPANTTYVAGSTTLNGAAATDITSSPIAVGSPGAPSGQLNVGSINAAVVMFQVTIVNPIPANTLQVVNTATANANGPAGPVPPATATAVTAVDGSPKLEALKSVVNLTRSSGTARPGDTLEYTITLTNTGDVPSTGSTLTDAIPLNTTYIAGSTTLNGATAPNMPGPIAIGTAGAVSGELRVGSANAAVVRFQVHIDTPFPPNVIEVVNRGAVSGNAPSGPVGPVESNQVATPVGANPLLSPLKSVVNLSRSSGTALPGDLLEYSIRVENNGDTAATSTSYADPIPANTTLVAGSTRLNGGVASDMPGPITINSPGAPAGELRAGAINAALIVFRVTIDNSLPPNVTEVRNQGSVSANGQGGAPLTPAQTNEVITPLAANPILSPTKTVVNLTRSSGAAKAGDALEYTVTVVNTGNISATGATLADAVPANTSYAAGSTTLNGVAVADVGGAMPYATSREIHSAGALAGQLNIGAAQSAVVRFRVLINNPLPPNVTEVVNNATANGNGPTGNEVGPQSPPPVITPVNASPVLDPVKSVVNLTRSGTAQPGDTLEYTVVVTNTGDIAATAASLSDSIPANTTYIAGSTLLNGAAAPDVAGVMPYAVTGVIQSPGAAAGQLDVGAAPSAVVKYQIRIDDPIPAGVTTVTNIATANANGPAGAPVGPVVSPPVVTPLLTNPVIEVVKTVANLTQTGIGPASPGDELEYTIIVTNTGNTPATSATVSDSIPANTTYISGSTRLNGLATTDMVLSPIAINSPGRPAGQLNVGAGNRAIVMFRIRIDNPLPPNVTAVRNIVTANGDGPGGPVGPVQSPPVITPVGATPVLTPTKTVANLTRGGATARPGDVLQYTVRVENTGNIAATAVSLSDPIPGNTTYVAGSTTLNGAPATDITAAPISINSPGAPAGQLNAGAAAAAIVSFSVTVNNPLPPNITQVVNLATVNGDGPTGNPVGPQSPPPVITPVNSMPKPEAVKSVANLTRSSGAARPGDTLEYMVIITNLGDIVGTNAALSDAIPANTTYVGGSTTLNGAAAGDMPGPIPIQSPGAAAGELGVGLANAATVRFRVTVNTPLPLGVSQVANQAVINLNGPAGPLGPTLSNPVVTPVTGSPVLDPVKSVVNMSRSSGTAQPGDQLEYTIVVTNSGDASSTNTQLIDPPPLHTTLVDGSVIVNGAVSPNLPGPITIQSPGAGTGVLDVGLVNAAIIKFRVTINTPVPVGVNEVVNQAQVSGTGPNGAVGPTTSNPTTTPLGANPALVALKSVDNLSRSSGTAQPGDLLSYRIIVSNTGDVASTGVTFSDPIPANTTYQAGSTTLNGAPAPDLPGPITIQSPGAVPVGEVRVGAQNQVEITFRVRINDPLPAGVTEIVNQGSARGNGQNNAPLSPASTNEVVTPLGANPILEPEKSVRNLTRSSGTAAPGDQLEYIITVRNTGNIAATGVILSDAIPANTSYVAGSTTLNGAAAPDDAGSMPFALSGLINSPGAAAGVLNAGGGGAATVAFRVTINSPLPPNITQVVNTATVNGNGPTGNSVGPQSAPPVITPVGAQPTLVPTKTVANLSRSSGPAQPGDTLEYTLTVTNTGNIAATAASVFDPIPANTTYVTASTTLNGAATTDITPGPITISSPGASAGQLNAGALGAAVVTFRVTINATIPVNVTSVSNLATFNANGPTGGPVGPVQPPEVITPILTNPSLEATKSVINLTRSTGAASPGDTLEYTITVTNTGDTPATGVSVRDPIPANTTYAAASTTLNGAAATDITVGELLVNSPGAPAGQLNLGPTQTAVVRFRVRINAPLPPNVVNVSNAAIVNGDGPGGPVGPVNPPPVITPVEGNPALIPSKTVVNLSRPTGAAAPGDVLEYTVRVMNEGNIAATNASLADPIPGNTTYVVDSTTLNGQAVADNAGKAPYSIAAEIHSPGAPSGQLNAGATEAAVVKFRVTIDNPLPPNITQVTNTATASANGPTGQPVGPQSPPPVITPVGAVPVLDPVKSVVNLSRSSGTARPGDTLEYTVVISNTGDIAATNATLTDPIPANTTYVAGSTTVNNIAAADIAGGAIAIQSPGAPAGQLNVGVTEAAVLRFRVIIDTPFPDAVTQATNAATANAQGPAGESISAPSNQVNTPVGANPNLVAQKSVVNVTHPNEAAVPDDVLEYTIIVTNNGETASSSSTLRDAIPAFTSYVAGSTTLNGAPAPDLPGPIAINTPGQAAGRILVGGAYQAVVRFRVRIINPLPLGATQVVNQAQVSGAGPQGPIGPSDSNNVVTPVTGSPVLAPSKSVVNLSRADAPAQPGDVLEYTVTLMNLGNTASTGTTLSDAIPANTTYVAGTTTLNDVVLPDLAGAMAYALPHEIHSPLAAPGLLDVGPANAAVIRFRVKIDDPVPAGFTRVVNIATAHGNGPGGPVGPIDSPPVMTPVGATPVLEALKSVTVVGGGQAGPGSELEYSLVITNVGNITSVNSTISDAIPQYTTYVAGSTTLNGSATTDITSSPIAIQSPGAPSGHLWVGAPNRAMIRFRVRVVSPLPDGAAEIRNQASANGAGQSGPLPALPTNLVLTPLGADLSITKSHTGAFAAGRTASYALTVTNHGPNPAGGAIGAITVTDDLPVGLSYLSGVGSGWSCAAAGQTVTCTRTTTMQINESSSITLSVGVSPTAPQSIINTATVNYPGDPNASNNTATDPTTITNGVGVPGQPLPGESSDQKPGSLLIYPVYTSDAVDPSRQNTRITMTNIDPNQSVNVHLFFVDGATCSTADSYLCLTPLQTTSFLASDIDPGVTGYLVAIAVDENGCPMSFNGLTGQADAKFSTGHSGSYGAEAYAALYQGSLPTCQTGQTTAEVRLDGVQYNQSARVLAATLPSPADGNDTMLVVTRTGGNLLTGGAKVGSLFGVLYDDVETAHSFTAAIDACQLRQSVSSVFPRTVPRVQEVISAGRNGWMKLWTLEESGIAGVSFNQNPNTQSVSGAFKGAHSLHRLKLATDVFTIPVFAPSCR